MIPPVLHKILHEKYVQTKFGTLRDDEEDQSKGWQRGEYGSFVYPGQLSRGGDFGQFPPESGLPPTEPPQTPPGGGPEGPRGGKPKQPSGDRPPSRASQIGRRFRGIPERPSYVDIPSREDLNSYLLSPRPREGMRLSPYFFDDVGGENVKYFQDLVNKYNPPPPQPPTPKSKFSIPPEVTGLGKFATSMGVGSAAGYYPAKWTQELTQPYLGDIGSYYAGTVAGTAAAIPAAEIAVTGIPALMAGEGIAGAASLTTAASASQLANPYTWVAALTLASIYPAEMIKAEQQSKILERIEKEERLRENKRKTNEILGIKSQDDNWWEQLKRSFAKGMSVGGAEGIMAGGRM